MLIHILTAFKMKVLFKAINYAILIDFHSLKSQPNTFGTETLFKSYFRQRCDNTQKILPTDRFWPIYDDSKSIQKHEI